MLIKNFALIKIKLTVIFAQIKFTYSRKWDFYFE